jgi:hypothetical protein
MTPDGELSGPIFSSGKTSPSQGETVRREREAPPALQKILNKFTAYHIIKITRCKITAILRNF